MEIGCVGDVIRMVCSTDGTSTVKVSKATYGLYDISCFDACCAPNYVYDCVEDLETVNPDFFEYLRVICDGQPFCSFDFNGYVLDSCISSVADYLQVFFECSDVSESPIAFMVRNVEREQLLSYEVVPWRDVITNFGGHYYPETYSFVCPVNGVYVISITVRTYIGQSWVYVLKNDEELFRVIADDENYDIVMSSNSGVIECQAGDVVWVLVADAGKFNANTDNYHLFSGFLLNKL